MNPIEYVKVCQCTDAMTKKRESVMTKIEAHETGQVSDMEHHAENEGSSPVRATLVVILSAGTNSSPIEKRKVPVHGLVRNLFQPSATVCSASKVSLIKCLRYLEFAESMFWLMSQDMFQRGRCSISRTSCFPEDQIRFFSMFYVILQKKFIF